jgi:hypothetical protein
MQINYLLAQWRENGEKTHDLEDNNGQLIGLHINLLKFIYLSISEVF